VRLIACNSKLFASVLLAAACQTLVVPVAAGDIGSAEEGMHCEIRQDVILRLETLTVKETKVSMQRQSANHHKAYLCSAYMVISFCKQLTPKCNKDTAKPTITCMQSCLCTMCISQLACYNHTAADKQGQSQCLQYAMSVVWIGMLVAYGALFAEFGVKLQWVRCTVSCLPDYFRCGSASKLHLA